VSRRLLTFKTTTFRCCNYAHFWFMLSLAMRQH